MSPTLGAPATGRRTAGRSLLAAVALTLATAVVCPAAPIARAQTRPQAAPVAPAPMPGLAKALAAQVNAVRDARQLRPLTISPSLARAASAHARLLAATGSFTHAWSDGRPFALWIRGFYPPRGFGVWAAGENLLWASPSFSARQAVSEWLASPTHRHILLMRSWQQLGIGVVKATGARGVFGGADIELAAAEFGVRTP